PPPPPASAGSTLRTIVCASWLFHGSTTDADLCGRLRGQRLYPCVARPRPRRRGPTAPGSRVSCSCALAADLGGPSDPGDIGDRGGAGGRRVAADLHELPAAVGD